MKSKSKIHGKSSAVSPVIATVILVAVAITVAVAVSYWMAGISSQYTSFEKVEILSGVCVKMDDGLIPPNYYWNITIKLKNTGTAPATLLSVFVNDVEVTVYGVITPDFTAGTGAHDDKAVTDMIEGITIESGASEIVNILIDYEKYKSLTSGTTTNIKIHSAGGMDYIKLVELV